jgi:hypothetical protein
MAKKASYSGNELDDYTINFALREQVRIMSEALQNISKHQSIVGGSLSKLSATKHIADKALKECGFTDVPETDFARNLIDNQQSLGSEFQKVLDDNLSDLYETTVEDIE